MTRYLEVTMPDSSKWIVPVGIIAANRAQHYAREYGGDLNRSLTEDTLPLFESDDYEVKDWAANNMNWSDVEQTATRVDRPAPVDYQEGWVNGDKRVISR